MTETVVPERVTEDELIARAIAPRVSKIEIDALVREGITLYDHAHHPLTICIFKHPNGFWIIGHSAPASPENYDASIGERLALERVISQLWMLEGFNLRARLYEKEQQDEVIAPVGDATSVLSVMQIPVGENTTSPYPGDTPSPEPRPSPEDEPDVEENPQPGEQLQAEEPPATTGDAPPGDAALFEDEQRRDYAKEPDSAA